MTFAFALIFVLLRKAFRQDLFNVKEYEDTKGANRNRFITRQTIQWLRKKKRKTNILRTTLH